MLARRAENCSQIVYGIVLGTFIKKKILEISIYKCFVGGPERGSHSGLIAQSTDLYRSVTMRSVTMESQNNVFTIFWVYFSLFHKNSQKQDDLVSHHLLQKVFTLNTHSKNAILYDTVHFVCITINFVGDNAAIHYIFNNLIIMSILLQLSGLEHVFYFTSV